jgi:hypothetical protein
MRGAYDGKWLVRASLRSLVGVEVRDSHEPSGSMDKHLGQEHVSFRSLIAVAI